MSNSPLADQDMKYRAITKPNGLKNYTPGRTLSGKTYKIDTISLHTQWGGINQSLLSVAQYFQKEKDGRASSNYGVDGKGNIAMFVPEGDTSWCTSSTENDVRAVTVEMAGAQTWASEMTDATINATINLCVDICKRNGIRKMHYYSLSELGLESQIGNEAAGIEAIPNGSSARGIAARKGNLAKIQAKRNQFPANEGIFTLHYFFYGKPCPGNYLVSKMPMVCQKVNEQLERFYGSKVLISDSSSEKELYSFKYAKDDANKDIRDIRLMYVEGYKYVPYNNFRQDEWLTEIPDFSKTSSFNTLYETIGTSIKAENADFFRTTIRFYNIDISDLESISKTYKDSAIVTSWRFSDATYYIKVEFDYVERDRKKAYATVRVYAKTSYSGAPEWADWQRVFDSEITTGDDVAFMVVDIIGSINCQSKKTPYVDLSFHPQFKIRVGRTIDRWFDFGGMTQKEDLAACYKGSYPSAEISVSGAVLSNDSSDIQVTLQADTFTALNKA